MGSSCAQGINFEVGLVENGDPRDNGLNCEAIAAGDLPKIRKHIRRPDFIIGTAPYTKGKPYPTTYLIGEIKYRPSSLYQDYVLNRNNKTGQLDAIRYYAGKHTYSFTAVFITLKRDPAIYPKLQAEIGKKCIEAGCIGLLITDLHVGK